MFRLRALLRVSLNGGSSMTLSSKGSKLRAGPNRARMPWTAAREFVPRMVLSQRDNAILEGRHVIEDENIDRMSQVDPLEVLKTAVASYRYHRSQGTNLFQLAAEAPNHGRGRVFYRKEWKEGTYDKHVTLVSVAFDRDGFGGTAHGYVTFHGETTLRPIEIDYADTPGWVMAPAVDGQPAPAGAILPPPPSIGTEVPVDHRRYALKAYPYYDAPNPPEFVERLLKDRGVLPDPPGRAGGAGDAALHPSESDGSVHRDAA